jgi:hypothetical protein
MTKTKRLEPHQQRQLRWRCSHCGSEGWFNPLSLHLGDPRTDHDRPDGRQCLKARKGPEQ